MGQSWSRVVDDLGRIGSAASLQWGDFTLRTVFQPILGTRRGECAGYEALLRVVDAQGLPVLPKVLLARAAREGALVVLDRVCRALHLRNFATVDPGDGRLFLNVEPEAAIADATCVREFSNLIRYYGLAPKRVCLEVVEHACSGEGHLAEAAEAYREAGMAIAMDDFGAGCSNFDRLAALRPDIVKVERTLLAAAAGEGRSHGMLPPMIRLLRDSGAKVAVERIETAHEALAAMEAGAAFLQGNYLAPPAAALPTHDLSAELLRRLWGMRGKGLAVATGD